MSSVSFCLIVKNEEKILEQTLNSIKDAADEIIIVDTGSTDNTVEIAKKFTDKVYYFEWVDDFAAARNYCNSLAKCEYATWWDADFLLDKKGLEELQKHKKKDFEGANLIHFNFNVEYNENHVPMAWIKRIVIFKKDDFYFKYPIHVNLFPKDNVKVKSVFYQNIIIDHLKDRTEKAHRYDQTEKIMTNALKIYPNDPYLLLHYAEGLIFQKKYLEAYKTLQQYLKYEDKSLKEKMMIAVEKIVFCLLNLEMFADAKIWVNNYYEDFKSFPRFILIYADATSIYDLSGALSFYEKFISMKYDQSQSGFSFDRKRFTFYPYYMSAKINYLLKNKKESKKYIEKARQYVCDEESKLKLTELESILEEID